MVDTSILDRIGEYRLASRRAVEATDAGSERQCVALLDLRDLALKEPDLTVRTWAERVIWAEAETFILGEEPRLVGDPWEQRQRELRSEGLARCPRCLSAVATEGELHRLQRERLKRIDEHEMKLRAVEL
jgi:hypothetical protein